MPDFLDRLQMEAAPFVKTASREIVQLRDDRQLLAGVLSAKTDDMLHQTAPDSLPPVRLIHSNQSDMPFFRSEVECGQSDRKIILIKAEDIRCNLSGYTLSDPMGIQAFITSSGKTVIQPKPGILTARQRQLHQLLCNLRMIPSLDSWTNEGMERCLYGKGRFPVHQPN